MAIQSIGAGGLDPIEKAQMQSAFTKNKINGLVQNLPSSVPSAISSDLLNQIYDQKAITPKVRAAVAAKQQAADQGLAESTNAQTQSYINDSLIAANREATSSEVPETRPDPVVKVDVVS